METDERFLAELSVEDRVEHEIRGELDGLEEVRQ